MNRFDPCPSCGQAHGLYQAHPNTVEGSSFREIALAILVLITWWIALGIAVPVIFEALR